MKAKLQLLNRIMPLIREAEKAGEKDPGKTLAMIFEAKKKMNFFKIKNRLK
jgi:hypothetical protein